jgi:hypothetical protein
MRNCKRFIYDSAEKHWNSNDINEVDFDWFPNITIVAKFVVSYRKLVSMGISPSGIPKGTRLVAVKDIEDEEIDYYAQAVTDYYLFTFPAYRKLRRFYGQVLDMPTVEVLYSKPQANQSFSLTR